MDPLEAFAALDLSAVAARLVELEHEIRARVPGVALQLRFRAEIEAWRVVRDDGTDVAHSVSRCTLAALATRGRDGARHGVSASIFSPSPDLLADGARVARFLRRTEAAARLAASLPDALPHPPGSFPIVIDYALG